MAGIRQEENKNRCMGKNGKKFGWLGDIFFAGYANNLLAMLFQEYLMLVEYDKM